MSEKEATEGVLAKRHSARSIISKEEYTLLVGRGKAAVEAGERLEIRQLPPSRRQIDAEALLRQWCTADGQSASPVFAVFVSDALKLSPLLKHMVRQENRWLGNHRLRYAPSYEDYAFFTLAWSAARSITRRRITRNPAVPLAENFRWARTDASAEAYYSFLLGTSAHDEQVLTLNGMGPDDDFEGLPAEFDAGERPW
ncbi:MAG: hypothetical protein H2043_11015 [Rhizobiales bacterium]|nr:hypothetical protein [Hyphomicrobiales bacterium]